MDAQQYQQAQAALAQADAEIADCRRQEQDCIIKAREQNNLRRTIESKRIGFEQQSAPLREECAAYAAEVKRQQAEKMKAEAEAKAKEREAAKAKEVSEADKLRTENEELKAQLAAKA